MMSTKNIYEIDFSIEEAKDDIARHQAAGNLKLIVKIDTFLDEIELHPLTGTGKPERLKGYGDHVVYSRRINDAHRLVYEVIEEEKKVRLLSAWGHYNDK